ncbi:flagellar export protein FliJ [Teredinibacter franksiae]|uniref:flagellar export protein FliJ n=1 Tax=Teredinibacter franksiae TaxID=2761453 RepID=UPI001626AE5D|nr:flagellar export protein FliJ [Teredinibacter franksiae]
MAAKRSKRMDIVIELARRKQDSAALELRDQQKILQASQQRWHELKEYYQHYESAFAGNNSKIRASQLGQSRTFLQQMSQAIEGQGLVVQQAEKQLLQAQAEWQKCYLKQQSLIDLQQRYVEEEGAMLERKEQAQIEEWVAQRNGHIGPN